ncbi:MULTISPECIES: phosphodiester glycosidase family protein [Paenibacillus]|uniref:phosphodiester glycosidase family protein n=1 Tax=Paenibacillus TaxID=44249 RepID=UPI001F2FCAD2|nr:MULTISPECIES: phosphodiester glycosidase family protein [Paenibacillus]
MGRTEELRSIAKRSSAAAAINGTFFDAYTSSSYKAPYGYIASGGKLLKNSPADRRAVFAYDPNGLAELVPGQDFLARFQAGEFDGGLQAGPRLLVDGKVSLNVTAEGFRDPKILTGGGARSALGLTKDHKLLLVTVPGATIPQLAEIMKQAGAYQAMNLDGGASSGLYAGGQYLTTPGRLISNALVVSTR